MKNKYIFLLSVSVLLSLFLSLSVYAEDLGYIVTLKKNSSAPFSDNSALLFSDENVYDIENIHGQIYSVKDKETLDRLIEDEKVESYEEDQIVYLFDDTDTAVPDVYNDPYFSSQWYWDTIKAGDLRKITTGSKSVRIGMIDSGICYSHPDFAGANIETGYDILNKKENAEAEYYHGVFASGIICAQANNNEGIAGICDGVTIVPIKCFTSSTSSMSNVIDGMYKAIDDYACDILNLSLGAPSESNALKAVINYAVDNNVIMVAAVGNKSNSTVYYPAGSSSVIGVGAVAQSGNDIIHSSYSQVNSSVYISAPGTAVVSTSYTDTNSDRTYNYKTGNGTSYAAPMVSAFLAAVKSVYPELTVSEAFEIIQASAEDLGDEGYDTTYGYGVINMKKGMDYLESNILLKNTPKPTPTVSPSPTITPKPTPTASPAPTITPEPTPTVSPSPTITPEPTPTTSPTPTITPEPTPTVSPSPTITTEPVPTVSAIPSETDIPSTINPMPSEELVNIHITENKNDNTFSIILDGKRADDGNMLILAFYDENGNVIDIKICNVSLAYSGNIVYNIKSNIYKAMLWSGLDTMYPVACKVITE